MHKTFLEQCGESTFFYQISVLKLDTLLVILNITFAKT